MGADTEASYPGDELPGVWESLPFIEALKTGAPPEVETQPAAVSAVVEERAINDLPLNGRRVKTSVLPDSS